MKNWAFFGFDQRRMIRDLAGALWPDGAAPGFLLVSDTQVAPSAARLSFGEAGFLESPISFKLVTARLLQAQGDAAAPLVVDMSWALASNAATANFESWMNVAEELAARLSGPLISLYNRNLLIDQQMLAALRGHREIVTASGVMVNPHYLPSRLVARGTLREQVDHWLGGISPELEAAVNVPPNHAAEGADPKWLRGAGGERGAPLELDDGERWKIRCLGRLRVYLQGGSQMVWDAPGGATRKTKTLFAYLLQKGAEGAEAEDLADLLWPDSAAAASRNRLHHTVRFLRQAVSPQGEDRLMRDGSRYVLLPPERSWLDISAFEQLCRQANGLQRSGASDDALVCMRAADRLYTGDLFADIPAGYVDDDSRDWCWSKRIWLREMFFKVQRDAAVIYRQRQDFSSALAHCQKALAIDPLCEIAHEEAMRIFHAQGRHDALDRQYKLYLNSLGHFDDRCQSLALKTTYEGLKAGQKQ